MTKKNITSFIFMLALICYSSSSLAGDFSGEVAIANDLYANNKFQQAADSYESLIKKGLNNGYLHYNLGNTYIRLGKTGPAILNYIRAQKLLPRDENLKANLNFAIQQTRDKIPPPSLTGLSTFFFWVNDLTLSENISLAMMINLIFWLLLTAWTYFRSDFLRMARNSLLAMLLLTFVSLGVKLHLESNSKTGVVLAKTVAVKSGIDMSNITLFELHEGALVTITDERRNWFEVRLDPKQKGWVPKESLGV